MAVEPPEGEWVRVVFPLEVDEDGWPPFGGERMWARPLGERLYEIRNVPVFAHDVSWGDVVTAEEAEDGALVFRAVVRRSGHSTVRVMVEEASEQEALEERLQALGCDLERSTIPGLFAASVPPDAPYGEIWALLRQGTDAERWGFQEAHRTEAHEAQVPDDDDGSNAGDEDR